MQRHAEIGHRLLSGSAVGGAGPGGEDRARPSRALGWGRLPYGLAGEAIPLEGRIASVADVFDALTTDRVYRRALPVDEALSVMREQRGLQFDPLVFDVLEDIARETEDDTAAESDDGEALQPDTAPAEAPIAVGARTARGSRTARGAELSERQLRRACRAAERGCERGRGRSGIEEALATICAPFEGSLLASVYAVEHDRLWLVAQHGYTEVRDGFELAHGVMGRAVTMRTIQFVADVAADADFIAATGSITSEVAIPFQAETGVAGVLNLESVGVRLRAPRARRSSRSPPARRARRRESGGNGLRRRRSRPPLRPCELAPWDRRDCRAARRGTTARILGLSLGAARPLAGGRRPAAARQLLAAARRPSGAAGMPRCSCASSGSRTRRSRRASWPSQQVGLTDGSTDSLVVLPLRAGGAPVGRSRVVSSALPPSKERLEAATLFAQHTAALLDVATALRREQRAAVTDQLTGLLNRRGFEERFQEELRRGRARRACRSRSSSATATG